MRSFGRVTQRASFTPLSTVSFSLREVKATGTIFRTRKFSEKASDAEKNANARSENLFVFSRIDLNKIAFIRKNTYAIVNHISFSFHCERPVLLKFC